MNDLIARLEAASEGSRELDRAIDLFMNPDAKIWSPEWYSGGKNEYLRWPDTPTSAIYRQVWHYTTSIGHALTLWETPDLDRGYPRHGVNLFYAVLPGGKIAWNATAWEQKDGGSVIVHIVTAHHRSRPISAVIAALKARAAFLAQTGETQ